MSFRPPSLEPCFCINGGTLGLLDGVSTLEVHFAPPRSPSKVGDALILTRAVRALLDVFGGMRSIGALQQLSKNSAEEDPPLYLWVRFQPYRSDTEKSAIYTIGLGLGLREIKCEECDWSNTELLDFVYSTALYILTSRGNRI